MYWIRPPGIISKSLPELNRYTNLINITTQDISTIDDSNLSSVCEFINSHYLRTSDAEYNPSKENIIEYFKSSNHVSYLTIYKETNALYKSVITARPLYVSLKGVPTFPTYYVDNLCVHPDVRKKGIAPATIQTHYYNLRHLNSKINTCLFKREGNMTAIVPLTTFITYGFELPNLKTAHMSREKLPDNSMSIIELTEQNIHLFTHFMKANIDRFDCVIIPDIANVVNLIKTKNIYIYGIIKAQNLISSYIFKNPSLKYDGINSVVECIATIRDKSQSNNDIFMVGFNIAIDMCRKHFNTTRLIIENTSDSNYIIDNLKKKTNVKIFTQSPTAFFFYNYACYSIVSNSCLLLY